MGVLSISAPPSLEAALANSATVHGVEADVIFRDADKIYITLTGDGVKCIRASAFEGVHRINWIDKAALTADDRKTLIKAPRRGRV